MWKGKTEYKNIHWTHASGCFWGKRKRNMTGACGQKKPHLYLGLCFSNCKVCIIVLCTS